MIEPFYHDNFDDDGPSEWADPAIRRSYEAALGPFILAHNEVDRNLTVLIQKCLTELGDPPGTRLALEGNFANRLATLAILKMIPALRALGGIDIAALTSKNGIRNLVAHGHFDQDPYMGDYVLVTKEKRKKYPTVSTKELENATEVLQTQNRQMGAVIAFGFRPPEWTPPATLP